MGPGDHVPAPASEPSADAIGAVLPRGCTFSYEALLRPARVHALPQLLDAPAVPEQAVAVPLPWAGRLRSSSRASLGQDEASLPPPPLPPPAHAPPRASLLPAPWQPQPPAAAMHPRKVGQLGFLKWSIGVPQNLGQNLFGASFQVLGVPRNLLFVGHLSGPWGSNSVCQTLAFWS